MRQKSLVRVLFSYVFFLGWGVFFHCDALVFFSSENVDSLCSGMRHFLRLLIPGCRGGDESESKRERKGRRENVEHSCLFLSRKKRRTRYKNKRTLSQKGGERKSVFFSLIRKLQLSDSASCYCRAYAERLSVACICPNILFFFSCRPPYFLLFPCARVRYVCSKRRSRRRRG